MQSWVLRTWQLQQELLAGSTRCAWRLQQVCWWQLIGTGSSKRQPAW